MHGLSWEQVSLGFAGHTWVDAGATASAAVVLFSNNYFPPDRDRKLSNINVHKHLETANWIKANLMNI